MIDTVDEEQAEHLDPLRAKHLFALEVFLDRAPDHPPHDSAAIDVAVGLALAEPAHVARHIQLHSRRLALAALQLTDGDVAVDVATGAIGQIVAVAHDHRLALDLSQLLHVDFDRRGRRTLARLDPDELHVGGVVRAANLDACDVDPLDQLLVVGL